MKETPDRDGLRILVIDDEEAARETLLACFDSTEHAVRAVATGAEALDALRSESFELAFLDLRLDGDGEDGARLVPRILEASPHTKVVVVSAHGTIESAVELIRAGASDFLQKPISPAELRAIAARIEVTRQAERRLAALERSAEESDPPLLESDSPAMRRAISIARRSSGSDATVLLRGESGTGKGVLARAIHAWSDRAEGPFSVVNCPSLSSELLRSELFGHVKGAFTGAVKTTAGKIEITDGGTLLLDEIGDLPLSIQAALLRFLQDREYERVGDPRVRKADVRIVAATNRDLEEAVRQGEFREDLYFRLDVISIRLPPLRERRDDIVPLAREFLGYFSSRYGRPPLELAEDAIEALREADWIGNVRELRNAIQRAAILGTGPVVRAEHLPLGAEKGRVGPMPLDAGSALLTLEEMEARYIRHVLDHTDSIERAAEVLDVSPSTLWRRRRKYGI
jgi:NtrC-family two-component system response regulator AlgB